MRAVSAARAARRAALKTDRRLSRESPKSAQVAQVAQVVCVAGHSVTPFCSRSKPSASTAKDQIAKRRIEDALRDPGEPEADTLHEPEAARCN